MDNILRSQPTTILLPRYISSYNTQRQFIILSIQTQTTLRLSANLVLNRVSGWEPASEIPIRVSYLCIVRFARLCQILIPLGELETREWCLRLSVQTNDQQQRTVGPSAASCFSAPKTSSILHLQELSCRE